MAGKIEAVEVLLSHGAMVDPPNSLSPLATAAGAGHLNIMKFLLKHGANPNSDIRCGIFTSSSIN